MVEEGLAGAQPSHEKTHEGEQNPPHQRSVGAPIHPQGGGWTGPAGSGADVGTRGDWGGGIPRQLPR